MNRFSKMLAAAAAATISGTAAAPADARPRFHRHHDGVDVGDVVAGVAIVGGIAALASAIDHNSRYDRGYGYDRDYRPGYGGDYRHGYDRDYGHGRGYGHGYGGERQAVDLCVREAERRFGARVRDIDDVDRDDGYWRVRGDVYVRDYDDRDRGYYGRPDVDSENFTCTVAGGRIYDFRISGDNRW
ncbi:MAG TPA: hypothetical protein VGW34_04235 [Allosphingosinicella sp.]|nr:hypothetical protein [Allosphingosinicella sp.]